MINNLSRFLKKADQFGANYKPSYAYGEVQYRTTLGGMLSIFLYGLSLSYLVYELVLWRTGKMLPKVTSLKTEIEAYTLKFSEISLASFCLRRYKNMPNQIDPFDPNNLVLLPMLYEIVDDQMQSPKPLISSQKSLKYDTFMIEFKNFELSNNENKEWNLPNKEYMIAFQSCKQSLLPEGWSCADEDIIIKFYNQKSNQLYVTTTVNQFNTSTRQLDLIQQDYYISFDNKTTYYSQISVYTSNVSVDTGFLLEDLQIFEFPSQIIQFVQQMDIEYFESKFDEKVFVIFEFELGTLQDTVFIEFSKVSEVLANIGSIISFVLFFSNVAYMINEQSLNKKIIKAFIEMYYPQMKQIKFIKNIFGSIKEVKFKDQSISANFIQFYDKLMKIAENKLSLTNQLYEVTRLQFILRSICDKDTFHHCHTIGIKLKDFIIDKKINFHNSQEMRQENIEDQENSHEELQIIKIVFIDFIKIPQSILDPNNDQLHFSQNMFIAQPQSQEQKNLCLDDEDFYILMQQQLQVKEIKENLSPQTDQQNISNQFQLQKIVSNEI